MKRTCTRSLLLEFVGASGRDAALHVRHVCWASASFGYELSDFV